LEKANKGRVSLQTLSESISEQHFKHGSLRYCCWYNLSGGLWRSLRLWH